MSQNKNQVISMQERAKSFSEHASAMQMKECLASLIQLELQLRENDRRVKDKLSPDDLKKLRGMLKEPQPKGFKTFLKAAIASITKTDLDPREVLYAVCDAEAEFFRWTSAYQQAFASYKEQVKAKLQNK